MTPRSPIRVTVTLPSEMLEEIERIEKNRSKFVLEAVRRELQRRRQEELRRSLDNPHADTDRVAEMGIEEWARSLPDDEAAELLDLTSGTPVRWVPGEGWVDEAE